jgi:hypothetical protein
MVSELALLGIINWVLRQPAAEQSSRELISKASDVVSEFKKDPVMSANIAQLSKRHLPPDLAEGLEKTESPREFFQFSR